MMQSLYLSLKIWTLQTAICSFRCAAVCLDFFLNIHAGTSSLSCFTVLRQRQYRFPSYFVVKLQTAHDTQETKDQTSWKKIDQTLAESKQWRETESKETKRFKSTDAATAQEQGWWLFAGILLLSAGQKKKILAERGWNNNASKYWNKELAP